MTHSETKKIIQTYLPLAMLKTGSFWEEGDCKSLQIQTKRNFYQTGKRTKKGISECQRSLLACAFI